MTITAALIEKAKLNQGFNSDYQLANALHVDRQKISNWKKSRSEANAEMTLKLMKLGGISVDDVLNKYENGSARVSLLAVTGLLSTLALAPFVNSVNCILCKVEAGLNDVIRAVFARFKLLGMFE